MLTTVKNLALFKIGWLICVISAAKGVPHFGLIGVACVAAVALYDAPNPPKEFFYLAIAALIGLAWESALVMTGVVTYPGHESNWIAPVWIVAMWVLFATTINIGLSWVKRHWGVAAVAGLLGGPMAFYGGMSLGAVEFANPAMSLFIIGLGWGVLLPILALIAEALIDSTFLEFGYGKKGRPMTEAQQAVAMLQSGSEIK